MCPAMAKLTFLGTGLMGAALAEAAKQRGDDVTVWNRTRAKAEALAALGIRVASTPAEAIAGAERVHSILGADDSVDAVYEACGDALGAALVIDHTTTSPAGTARRAAELERRGVAFLHAPVFMSPAACRAAQGVMLVAGPKSIFSRAEPALAQMTGKVRYLGERRDLAAANKLFGNAMIIAITAGLADVFSMGKSLGITPEDVLALFSIFNPASTLSYRGAAMAKGDYRAAFELTMARKDARLAIEAAGGLALATLPAIATRMDELISRGFGADDMAVLGVDAVPKA